MSLALSGDGGGRLSTETGKLVLELRGLVGEETQSKGTSSPFRAPHEPRVTNHCCHNGRTYQLICTTQTTPLRSYFTHAQCPEMDVKRIYRKYQLNKNDYCHILYRDISLSQSLSSPLSIQLWTSI